MWAPTVAKQTRRLERFHSKYTTFCTDLSISKYSLTERRQYHMFCSFIKYCIKWLLYIFMTCLATLLVLWDVREEMPIVYLCHRYVLILVDRVCFIVEPLYGTLCHLPVWCNIIQGSGRANQIIWSHQQNLRKFDYTSVAKIDMLTYVYFKALPWVLCENITWGGTSRDKHSTGQSWVLYFAWDTPWALYFYTKRAQGSATLHFFKDASFLQL